MKNPFAKRKIVIVAAGLLAAFHFSGSAVSAAGDYYDGEKDSHQTGVSSEQSGGSGSVPGTFVEHNAEKVASFVASGSYGRTNQHVADYANGNCKNGWKVRLADGSWVSYEDYNGILKASVPTPSSWPASLHAVIDANGCLRYKCPTCSGYQYAIDAELYGYYDNSGVLTVTGWTAQMAYCGNCTPLSAWNNVYDSVSGEYSAGYKVGSVDGQVVGQEFVPDEQDSSYGYHGVYVYNGLTMLHLARNAAGQKVVGNVQSDMVLAFDPGILDGANTEEYIKNMKAKQGQMIGNTGKYILYEDEDGDVHPAVEITNKVTNNVNTSFGYHTYEAYHEYVNFEKWVYYGNKNCVQRSQANDDASPYQIFAYENKIIGALDGMEGGEYGTYGYYAKRKCGYQHLASTMGFCADCGERVTPIIYATPETMSTVRRVKNGMGYLCVCPVQSQWHDRCSNMVLDGTTFRYIYGHVETSNDIIHACKESCVNQYYLQFESNSPDPAFFENSSYKVGGYFYKIYEDGKNMYYTPEGQRLAYDFYSRTVLENGNVIMASVTPTSSRNSVDEPKFNSKGYDFAGWELYDGSSWVSVGKNPTWKDIVSKIGGSNDLLKNDGSVIRLRAQWTAPTAVLKVVDGDTIVDGKIGNADVVGSYTVPYMRTTAVSDPGNKNGVLKFVAENGVANPSDMGITAIFSSFSDYSGNKGIFDAATKTYMNADSEDGRVDYVIANYSWQTITLPSLKKQGYVFMGWYTGENGTGLFCGGAGAPYTPRDSATLYGYWKPDTMPIGATVQSPNGHIDGISDVDWNYNNSDIYGFVTYKIYRKEGSYPNNFTFTDNLLTNGNIVGSKVDETPITFTKTGGSGEYTVQNEGVYEITLQGQAGRSVTGANGGAGATYKLTMYLKKGDVLKYDTGATTGNYGGGTGSILRGSGGTFGAGGNAAVLSLTRSGSTSVVAVAGGGGGAIRLPDGTAIAGGNAVQDLSINGTKTLSSDPYTIFSEGATDGSGIRRYSVVSSGGGGGYYTGTAGRAITSIHEHKTACLHTHTYGGSGNLVSGTALTDDAIYSESGGCYTATHYCGTFNQRVVDRDYYECPYCHCGMGVSSYEGWPHHACSNITNGTCTAGDADHNSHCIPNSGVRMTFYNWNCSNYAVCGEQGDENAAHYNYALGCGGGTVCTIGTVWGENAIQGSNKELHTASTGGSCYYNPSYVMSATFDTTNMNTNAQGSFSLSSKVLGITTTTSLVDKDTDDKAAPNTPVVSGALKATETVVSGNTSDIYLSNISWNSVADNGTPYTFRGETWDIQTTKYEKKCSTTVNAIVTVTSGVDHYQYEVYKDGSLVASGTTTDIKIPNVKCVSAQSKAAAYSYNLTINVWAYDKAGNKSGCGTKTVNVSYAPGSDEPTGHIVGVLDAPTVAVAEGKGIYKDGNTYYVKADGVTKVTTTVRAHLSSVQKSRITSASLGDKSESYGAGFLVQTSLANHTVGGTTIGGSIGSLTASGSGSILSLTNNETRASQSFTTTKEETIVVRPYAEANCLGDTGIGCAITDHALSKEGSPVTIIGDKMPPVVNIAGISGSFQGENNFADTKGGDWSNSKVNISVTANDGDGGSGVASVEIRNEDGTTVAKSTPTGRTTNVTVPWTANTNGIKNYEIIAADNVGNTTTVNITVRINKQRPVITDNSSGVALNGSVKCMAGTWRSTSTDATWEYDWSLTRPLAYTVEDTVAGLKSVRFYQTSASYQGVVKNIFSGTYNGTSPVYIFYDVDTEGTSYYVIEAVTMSGTKTTVHIKARRDSTGPIHTGYSRISPNFESFTMAEANNAVNNGNLPEINTTWVIGWRDANLDGIMEDSAGIQSATLYVYNANDTSDMKSYPMLVKAYGSYTAPRVNDFNTPLDGAERWYNKDFTVSINTFTDFPYAVELKWYVEAKDNVGNTRRQYGKTADGSDDIIPNFLVKTVAWATKDGAYNVKSDNGVSNTPYFKTGELGFLEVWTIGYVENIELDFTEGGVGKEAADEIARGAYDSKYALGVHGDSPRIVTTVRDHKAAAGGIPDREDGIPYATHYVYNYSFVEHSIGTADTAGWKNDGTYIRIPPAHTLTSRNEKDKYGNDLFFWEVREARVYASKGSYQSSKYAETPYVIWDESGDDVHYRIIHGTLGF